MTNIWQKHIMSQQEPLEISIPRLLLVYYASLERGHLRILFSTLSFFDIFINLLNWVIDSICMKFAHNTDSGATANILYDKIKIYI